MLETTQLVDLIQALLSDNAGQQFLRVNRWDGVLWFNKESFDRLLAVIFASTLVEIGVRPRRTQAAAIKEMLARFEIVQKLQRAEAESKFQVEGLLAAARQIDAPKRRASATRKKTAKLSKAGGTRTKTDKPATKSKKKR